MDLDGAIKLNDAQIKSEEASADIAGKMADVAIKWQQANHASLENLRLLLNIEWDADAHRNLIRITQQSLQQVRILKEQGEKLRSKLHELTWLMAGGGDWERVRDGWIAFEFVRTHLPFAVTMRAVTSDPAPAAYDSAAWRHPINETVTYGQPHDAGALMDWARRHTYFPVLNGPAWQWLAGYLLALDTAATNEAAVIQARVEAAKKDALALQERDWDRLKQSQSQSTAVNPAEHA